MDDAAKLLNRVNAGGGNFTHEDARNSLDMTNKLAAKQVLGLLAETLKDAGDTKLAKKVAKLHPGATGWVSIGFKEVPERVGISLHVARADWKIMDYVLLPSADYLGELKSQFKLLLTSAMMFWDEFAASNPAIVARAAGSCPSVDFSKLLPDPSNPTTLYWPSCKHRLGLYCYPIDSSGKVGQFPHVSTYLHATKD